MNAAVAAIVAMDTSTGTLYGVSNNGMARMRSEDQGVTWYTVPAEVYTSRLAQGNMLKATFVRGPA